MGVGSKGDVGTVDTVDQVKGEMQMRLLDAISQETVPPEIAAMNRLYKRYGATFGEGNEGSIYRYMLWRIWDDSLPRCAFIMLNPSTADALIDDPTIRRCVNFAKAWGYGGMRVANLFAFRSPDPKILTAFSGDIVGPDNNEYLSEVIHRSGLVIVAWGNHGGFRDRDLEVLALLRSMGREAKCLGVTDKGFPGHPLYIASSTTPTPYPGREAVGGGAGI